MNLTSLIVNLNFIMQSLNLFPNPVFLISNLILSLLAPIFHLNIHSQFKFSRLTNFRLTFLNFNIEYFTGRLSNFCRLSNREIIILILLFTFLIFNFGHLYQFHLLFLYWNQQIAFQVLFLFHQWFDFFLDYF